MKRYLWLAFAVIPVLALGVVSDVAAGQVEGINGEGGRPFTTVLMGANEVPAAPGSDLVGTARVTINLGQSELCWDLDYTTTQHVVAAHIHKGPAGVAAPVVFGFFNPPASAVVVNTGCREGAPALLADIAANPGAYYVNVHTTAHPGGAGRGQLTK
jgi:CHRD domain-containing protein